MMLGDNDKPQEEMADVVLTITIDGDGGGLKVSAPGDGSLFDEPLCLWMLDKAKDYIKFSNAKGMQSKVLTPKRKPFYRGFGRKK